MNGVIKPQGPIYNGDSIYFGMIGEDNSYYVLTSVPNSTSTPSLVFQKIFINDNVSNEINPAVLNQLVSFRVVQNGDALALTTSNNFLVGTNTSNVVITTASSGELFYLIQSIYQGLATPSVLMSGVKYRVLNKNGNSEVLFNISGLSSPTNVMVIPLPTTVYTGSGQISTDPRTIIFSLNFCSYVDREWCHRMGFDSIGAWTTLREAQIGNIYAYCPVGVFCSNQCVSFCSSSCCDNVDGPCSCSCVFNASTGIYECLQLLPAQDPVVVREFVQTSTPPPTQPTTSYIGIIALILFAIFIIILIAYFLSRNRQVAPKRKRYHREEFITSAII